MKNFCVLITKLVNMSMNLHLYSPFKMLDVSTVNSQVQYLLSSFDKPSKEMI